MRSLKQRKKGGKGVENCLSARSFRRKRPSSLADGKSEVCRSLISNVLTCGFPTPSNILHEVLRNAPVRNACPAYVLTLTFFIKRKKWGEKWTLRIDNLTKNDTLPNILLTHQKKGRKIYTFSKVTRESVAFMSTFGRTTCYQQHSVVFGLSRLVLKWL